MRNVILTMLLLLASVCYSQSNLLGISGEAGLKWNTNLYPTYQNKAALYKSYGLTYVHRFKKRLGLGVDVMNAYEGAKLYLLQNGPVVSTFNLAIDMHYVRVPLKLYYFFQKRSSPLQIMVYAGPSFGYLLHGYEVTDITAPGATILHYEQNTTSVYNYRTDVGLQTGADMLFHLSKKSFLSAGINYYAGFKNMWDVNRKNSHAAVNVSIYQNFGRK